MCRKSLDDFLSLLNYKQEKFIDCGIAVVITVLRTLGLFDLTVYQIYKRFQLDTVMYILDIAAAFQEYGVTGFIF
jgi:hypothetical protein